MKIELLTWDEFNLVVNWMSYVSLRDMKAVVAPRRGGLPLGVALSHRLDIPLIIAGEPARCSASDKLLWVDDIVDSGQTLREALDRYGQRILPVCWIGKNTMCTPYRYVNPDTWVVFPWEDAQKAEKDKEDYERRRSSQVSN